MSTEHSEHHERKHLMDEEINQPVHQDHEDGSCDAEQEEREGLGRPASQPASGEPDPGH